MAVRDTPRDNFFAAARRSHCAHRNAETESHPRSIASLRPALYSAGLPFNSDRNGQLIFSMWMRPSCTGRYQRLVAVTALQSASRQRPLFAAHRTIGCDRLNDGSWHQTDMPGQADDVCS